MEKKELTKNYYNAIAKGYEELYGQEQREKFKSLILEIPSKGKILDAGFGTGIIQEFLPKNSDITALDISEELLKQNPINKQVIADIENTPFENEEFDTITSITVIQDLTNIDKYVTQNNKNMVGESNIDKN